MIDWFTSTVLGKLTATFFISMFPVVELRGGLPYGIALGLPPWLALAAALAGNFLPVPFIILYIKRVLAWMRRKSKKLDTIAERLEKKAHLKGKMVRKYSFLGLTVIVAIPLPGTGAWTGALVAAILDMRVRYAVPAILLGLVIAAALTAAATFGVIHFL